MTFFLPFIQPHVILVESLVLNPNFKVMPMKKILYLLIFLLGSSASYGQSQIGMKIAGGISNIRAKDESVGPKFCYQIGVVLTDYFHKEFGFQLEVLYAVKGAESIDEPPVVFDFSYIEIPVLMKFKLTEIGQHKGRMNLNIGMYYGLKQTGEIKIQDRELYANGKEDSDYGLIIGGDLFLDKIVSLDGRLSYGFSKITKSGSYRNLGLVAGFSLYF
ncbi:MAG: b-brl 2 protein [Ignavibacteria bacterium]|nr:b-brl 2 protein [Ignavibacteria bacterium]